MRPYVFLVSGTDVDICALLKKLSLRPMREKPRVRRVKKTKPGDGTYVHGCKCKYKLMTKTPFEHLTLSLRDVRDRFFYRKMSLCGHK